MTPSRDRATSPLVSATLPQSAAFVRAYSAAGGSLAAQRRCAPLFTEALGAHRKMVKAASAGHGIDRHLLGLQLAHQEVLPTQHTL